jgi:PAS domain S-box-containing protein
MPGEPDADDGDGAGAGASEIDRDAANAINQRIFATSLDLLLVVDRRGTFVRVSPSAKTILGIEPGDMVGRSARAFVHPPDLDHTRAEMRHARRSGLSRTFECRYMHQDGRPVPLSWLGVWSEPEQQYFFIGRDISEREAVQERLRQAQRMDAIGQLTGGLAHDFNNLLGVIIGNLDLLRLNDRLDPDDAELVGDAIEAALRGADLTRRLLAFARRQRLQPQHIVINDLVAAIAGLLARTLGEQVPIVLQLGDGIWTVSVDPTQLEASLVNLATNARDAMPGGGRLTIKTGNRQLDADYAAEHPELMPGDYAMIEVSDSGAGIPADILPRIFEPFFTTKGPAKGTGLGLSMVFGFVKQSGGHINVYSEPGVGTTFRLYLPRDASGAPAGAPEPEPPASVGGDETILIVEDNEAMRRVVKRQLTDLGYRVVEADSAAAALELLEDQPITLLFSDVVMPGEMDGIELARTAMTRWPALKVLLTSGFPESRLDPNGDDLAGLRLLGKPYRRDELARALREFLDPAAAMT